MTSKALAAIGIFSITAVTAFAQDEPVDQAPKLTLADVRHLAEVITSDKSKLRAYCELGELHGQTQQALCAAWAAIVVTSARGARWFKRDDAGTHLRTQLYKSKVNRLGYLPD